ncbi:MAG: Trk system potassium transporter TrkA [Paludibacter sp.]|nr:Trk system potassium transporter TrkA [Paludibacter sp.]MBP6661776.1 Trk system potassium transporter TrkA [Paludibacter sp.]MBP7612028.1 Trk system potassium transporter TrkA [Paludibacter sp.]MBP8782659.1 Trk system potassium transporter TrkA [Paludibacter sp.]
MKIIIAGAGEVGTHLAKLLARENFDTILLDEDPAKLKDLEASYDLMTYTGSPTSIGALKEAGVASADLFIGVTPSESVNMTACMLATNLGAKKTLARIDNYEYLQPKNKEFFEKLGVDYLIYPEMLAAREIVESLKTSWLRQNLSFCDNALILLGIKVRENSRIVNHKFSTGFFDHNKYRIVAIKRQNRTIIPLGSDMVLANDIVYFITTPEYLNLVKEEAGKDDYPIKNIMVMGGSRIAQKTIQNLSSNINIKILERDKEKSYDLAEKLDNAMIINCDGRNIELLKEEGIEEMDAFVAVTANSEANILACLTAKRLGVKKSVAEVENNDYIMLAESMDIGTVINKKMIAASYIYQLTLDADVLNVRSLSSADAEVVEFVAKPGSKITRSKIMDLRLPDQVNIGGFVRNGVGNIVNGNTIIMPNDHVIVFCVSSAIRKMETFFN